MSDNKEQQQFEQEVKDLKQWWTDSRWRYTRRPYTAEQIVTKRGSIKLSYPSNDMSKKLWNTVEQRFKVRTQKHPGKAKAMVLMMSRTRKLASPTVAWTQ